MNYLKKAVFVVVAIFPLLSLAACNPSKEEAVEKIESYLEQKYDEDFKVTAIGGGYGTLTTNTLKANVEPKDAPGLTFDAEITKDFKEVWDGYMNAVMAKKLGKDVAEMAQQLFGSEAIVKTTMSSGGLSFPDRKLNDKKMSVPDFLKKTPKTQIALMIFLNSNGAMDAGVEAEKINSLADQLLEQGIKTSFIGLDVFYVKPEEFAGINEKYGDFSNSTEAYEYYSNKERSYANAGMSLEENVKQESLEEIKSNFE